MRRQYFRFSVPFFLRAMGVAVLVACAPPSAEVQPVALAISDAWIAAPPSGAHVAAGYLVIRNRGAIPDQLVAVSSARARHVEIHEMRMDGAMMLMRAVTGVSVPARSAAVLSPGGLHLMFIDLGAGLVAGESIPVTLTFERAGVVNVAMPVRPRTAARPRAADAGN